ncbi:putative retrotransposon gag domain-containing protein [Helianthus annuus]|nr:putative retrotransposon gag domain-containing protein [Helianthus annuus]
MEIALAPLEKAKLPSNVGKFNGLADPDDHLRVFTSACLVGGWTLPLWCHLFVQTLTGPARIWFDNLPIGQIESWKDLREKFLTHFRQQRRSIRDTSDVMNIWRRDDESLEDFITRYNKEVLEIGGVHEQIIRAQFKYAVRCDDMIKVLSGTEGLPKSWEKIMAAAKVYAQTEKNLTTNRPPPPHNRPTDLSSTGERRSKKSWRESGTGSRSSEDARTTINKLTEQRENKHENRERQWTPLTKTPAEVLSTEDYQFKPPIPMKSKRGQDPAQYCEYHKDNGHATNNCISLRTEIEKALKSGELTHLLQNVRKEIKQITRGEEGPSKRAKT